MTKEQILEWLDKNNRGFTQKDFELFKKFYEEATKELEKLYKKADENWWNAQQTIKKQQEQIERMKCCGNCSHFKLDSSGLYPINVCELTYPNRCKDHDKWEIEK